MNSLVWIAYDLGVKGDYESLYAWLDSKKAKECGDSVACFSFEYEGDLLKAVEDEIKQSVSINSRTRIYAIARFGEKISGRFLLGKRKQPPWTGFALTPDDEESSDES